MPAGQPTGHAPAPALPIPQATLDGLSPAELLALQVAILESLNKKRKTDIDPAKVMEVNIAMMALQSEITRAREQQLTAANTAKTATIKTLSQQQCTVQASLQTANSELKKVKGEYDAVKVDKSRVEGELKDEKAKVKERDNELKRLKHEKEKEAELGRKLKDYEQKLRADMNKGGGGEAA